MDIICNSCKAIFSYWRDPKSPSVICPFCFAVVDSVIKKKATDEESKMWPQKREKKSRKPSVLPQRGLNYDERRYDWLNEVDMNPELDKPEYLDYVWYDDGAGGQFSGGGEPTPGSSVASISDTVQIIKCAKRLRITKKC